MSEERFDGIIIGAGHNGLITAAYMAKAGLKMAVFDPRINVGGASRRKSCRRRASNTIRTRFLRRCMIALRIMTFSSTSMASSIFSRA
ncbi:hypothetical protein E2553_37410 [Paraburkholderia dipogonis]|uniref:FAD-dependent oxidoreductase n=1 Tax=Paraburkholderia dipogonis TaxID=1211383 RepID=A0A4Y8MKX9_9BURK|nr:hypothetical protein E2553_37410 [Paraburkholderia dipogonis]